MTKKPVFSQAEQFAMKAKYERTLMDIQPTYMRPRDMLDHAERALSPRLAIEHEIHAVNVWKRPACFADVNHKTVTRQWSRQDVVRELVWC